MHRLFRFLGRAAAVLIGLAILGGGLFGVVVLSREPLRATPSTTHPSIARQACLDCHAPIAAGWRQSFHYRSLSGQYWKDVRDLGYFKVFDLTRKACVNCHAPANVLDLVDAAPAVADEPLGVECTPSLLREPRGVFPAARSDDVVLGVDCTSCHVSKRGIVGSGDHPTAAHETVADARFQTAVLTEGFGKDEVLLDFWPFNQDRRIAYGERKEILFPLPDGHGTVEAVIRYHDWMKLRRTLLTLKQVF